MFEEEKNKNMLILIGCIKQKHIILPMIYGKKFAILRYSLNDFMFGPFFPYLVFFYVKY